MVMATENLREPTKSAALKRGDALLFALAQFDPQFAEDLEKARRQDLPQQSRESLDEV